MPRQPLFRFIYYVLVNTCILSVYIGYSRSTGAVLKAAKEHLTNKDMCWYLLTRTSMTTILLRSLCGHSLRHCYYKWLIINSHRS